MRKEILPAVAAIVFNEEGEVLLQKRKDVGQWCVISGHVEFGETVEQAIIREIAEETNTEASIKRLIGVYSNPESQTYVYGDRAVQFITSYFEVQLKGKITPGFTNDESTELKYFLPLQLPDDMARIHPAWLSDALDSTSQIFIR